MLIIFPKIFERFIGIGWSGEGRVLRQARNLMWFRPAPWW
jgi:hypothetical protein